MFFTKEILFIRTFQIYTYKVEKSNKLILYYFYTYILNFILFFSGSNGCVGC